MTRTQLLATIGRSLNKADVLDARTQARLLDYINRRHRQIMSAPGMAGLRRSQFHFTTGSARNAFMNGERLTHLRDVTNDFELEQRSLATYRRFNPDPPQATGLPTGFIQYGYEPVAVQPADVSTASGGTLLFADSSSVADVAPLTLTVEATFFASTVTLTGTTPVALGGGPVQYITKCYCNAVPAGAVTLHADSPTGPVLTFLSGRASAQWLVFYLDPTPSPGMENTYYADIEFLITDLATDQDESQLPSDFHDLLEMGAIMDELAHTDDSRVVLLQQRYTQRFGELKLKLARMGVDHGPRGRGSRYGAWGPATSW